MWALVDAIKRGDLAIVKTLVEDKGADINGDDNEGFAPPPCHYDYIRIRVPLVIATRHEKTDICSYLLERGADVNRYFNMNKSTALHAAVEVGNLEIVQLLVQHKDVDVNARNSQSATPLDLAARHMKTDIAQVLLDHGADQEGPLAEAVKLNNLDLVRLFIRSGARPEQMGTDGWPILYTAAKLGSFEIARFLTDMGAQRDASSKANCPALNVAALQGHLKIVSYLLNQGWSPDGETMDKENPPPLIGALKHGRMSIIKLLLEQKPNVNQCDAEGIPCLFYAAELGDIATLTAIKDSGADMDAVVNGATPIQKAVAKGCLRAVKFFIRNGVKVYETDMQSRSLLNFAADSGDFPTFELLENKGASLNPTADFVSRMFAAYEQDDRFMARMLKYWPDVNKRDSLGWTPLTYAASRGLDKTLEYLLSHGGADIEGTTCQGLTALHKVSMYNYLNLGELLLYEGANPRSIDEGGETPLHCAARAGSYEMASLLIEEGADPSDINPKTGYSALHVAAYEGHLPIIELLLEHRSNTDIRDRTGTTALEYAMRQGHSAISTMLGQAHAPTATTPWVIFYQPQT